MSSAYLIPFKNSTPQTGIEFRNSWGGAARIWDALFKAYVPKKHQYDSWVCSVDDRRLWDLATREDLPLFERAVHAFTFDLFYVRREHFERLASDLRAFVVKYPVIGQVDHLPAWATIIAGSLDACDAFGLHATSVSENQWSKYDEKEDGTIAVSMWEGWEVYDWLEGKPQPEPPFVEEASGI